MANKETTDESVTTKKPAASRAKPKAKAAAKSSAETGKTATKKPAAKKLAAKAKKPAVKKTPAAKTSPTKPATKAAKPKAIKKASDKDDAKPKAARKKAAKKSSEESVATPKSESTGEVVEAKKTLAPTPDTATSEAKKVTSAKDEEKTASAVEGDEQFDALPALPENFDECDLAPPLRKALADMGYDRPMPVQQAVFQTLTAGKDLMVQSKTGSGKTAAFGIPISQLLSHEKKGVQALILAPTRELAMQVAKEIAKLVVHMDVSVVPIYGGTAINPQIEQLEAGAQIVAGTPGRVLDHIRRGTLKTSNIKMLTLDECDEMLSMGFQEEIENIIKTLPSKDKRQTLLFSATIPKEIERIGRRHMNEPVMISLSSDRVGADLIDHYYYVVSGMARTRDLLKIMKTEQPQSAIIFCNTREETNTVARSMRAAGYDAEALSSDLSQADRERVMGRMRDKNLQYLVATDIAARGIDISELSHVINYTFPNSPEIYVHRTGRTGRAGKQGTALSIVGPTEIGSFYYLKLIYKIDPKERDLPGTDELATIQEGERYQQVIDKVPAKARGEYLKIARRLWQSSEGERVVAVLLQELLSTKKPSAVARPAVEARSESPRSESPRSESRSE
ncbi:MAG: DEAD/DEAH box helicase, partial [Kofleriaceae bacterium]|nr:DEAD/DEAH box helicase [Kofleriaceae bacterium]